MYSRIRSLNTLKGMGNEARQIWVHRTSGWLQLSTEDLLPGDLFYLTKASKSAADGDNVVPCDALLIRGGVVVNESTLTGESVPQMKDGLATAGYDNLQEPINIKGVHKIHALFGGTRLLQVKSMTHRPADDETPEGEVADKEPVSLAEEDSELSALLAIAPPPQAADGGCLCFCSRTGFSSSQGKLVRMFENSTASVSGETRDTLLLLFILLFFALAASGYVFYVGMGDDSKSKYQLLLHCILIVTSVIPPELPMQTALAVNQSLMTLMKIQIFCTEVS